MSFINKVVIVTGASSGIGAATAVSFSSEGARVVLVGRNEDKLAAVAKKCKNPLVLRADVSKDEDVKKIIDQTLKKFGQLDVLVNNAGTALGMSSLIEGVDMKMYDSIMATNLRGAIYLTSLAAPYLIKTKGNVINISSVAGKLPPHNPSFIFYCVSKAGMDHFTRSAAVELGPHGVRVNGISPGPVLTDFLENNKLDLEWDRMSEITILNRVSKSEEIADLAIFLASDKAKSITGSDYVADNGTLLKR
ncbi:unnamed protein product, partial [Brenthis ino]